MRVLVTGGAGFIGSHVVVALAERGHTPVIVDSFINSSPSVVDRLERIIGYRPETHKADLLNRLHFHEVFTESAPDAIVHLAGLKAVGESVSSPLGYYRHNLVSTLNLLEVTASEGVRRIVFSSSATVYGDRFQPPFSEDEEPLGATSPYGQTKVVIERLLQDLAASENGWQIAVLRYFNPIGAHPSGLIGESPRGTPDNLAPYILKVAEPDPLSRTGSLC